MKISSCIKRVLLPMACCLAGAGWSGGAVTYVNPPDIEIPFTFGGVYLDLVTQGQSTPGSVESAIGADGYGISFGEPSGDWDVNLYFGGALMIHNTTFQPYREDSQSNNSAVHNVGEGEVIDGTTALSGGGLPSASGVGASGTTTGGDLDGNQTPTHMGTGPNQFGNDPGYIAFVLDGGTATPLYGWMQVTLQDDGTAGSINEWAYSEDPIEVGQIPEPGSVVLMALGGLALLRRRR